MATKDRQIADELLDQLLEGCDTPEDLLGKDGLIKRLTGRLVERVLDERRGTGLCL